MKKSLYFIFILASLVAVFSCKGKKGQAEGDSTAVEATEDGTYAVCVFDRASLKETPEEKGKWLEALSIGEKCEYLDDTKEDNSGSKEVKYYKVRLQGGKEGWVQANLMSLNSKPAALNQDADVYSRPDLLTKTAKKYSKMDIVAVSATEGDFIQVTGKRRDGKWVESGWIKSTNVTYSDVDIAVAKFGRKALAITDEAKQKEAIQEILNNTDFSNSIFIQDLNSIANPEENVDDPSSYVDEVTDADEESSESSTEGTTETETTQGE
jgi:hypothetical protein